MSSEFRVTDPVTGNVLVSLRLPRRILEAYRAPLGEAAVGLARLVGTASGGVPPESYWVETFPIDDQTIPVDASMERTSGQELGS